MRPLQNFVTRKLTMSPTCANRCSDTARAASGLSHGNTGDGQPAIGLPDVRHSHLLQYFAIRTTRLARLALSTPFPPSLFTSFSIPTRQPLFLSAASTDFAATPHMT